MPLVLGSFLYQAALACSNQSKSIIEKERWKLRGFGGKLENDKAYQATGGHYSYFQITCKKEVLDA